MENYQELFTKAKEVKTPEELLSLAKENGIEMTEESAKAYCRRRMPQERRKTCSFRRLFMRILGMQQMRSEMEKCRLRYF